MTYESLSIMPPIKILGLIGAVCYILNYTLLTSRILNSEHWFYFFINLMASSFVMISLSHEFNAATALIQSFFIGVSIWGLASRLHRRRVPPHQMRADRLRPLK